MAGIPYLQCIKNEMFNIQNYKREKETLQLCRYMAEILQVHLKTQNNQSIQNKRMYTCYMTILTIYI